MKFKFRFDSVMKHRKVLEDVAQREFQEAFSELKKQLLKLEEMNQQVHQAHQSAYQFQTEGGIQAPALSQVFDVLKRQDIRIERQQHKVQECEKQVEDLREILRQKAIDYKIIESLKEKNLADFNRQLLRTLNQMFLLILYNWAVSVNSQ